MDKWTHLGLVAIGWLICDDTAKILLSMENQRFFDANLYYFWSAIMGLGMMLFTNSILTIWLRARIWLKILHGWNPLYEFSYWYWKTWEQPSCDK